MPIYAGIGLVLLLEVAALVAVAGWRVRAGARRDRFADARHLTAVLEIEDAETPLPIGGRELPGEILRALRDDPLLGLADVHVVQQVQPYGAALPAYSAPAASYQGLNETLARRGGAAAEPVAAMRWTWLSLRVELPGSRNRAWAHRAQGPIEARGGGRLGAVRTLDKAVGTAAARLGAAGFVATRLDEDETRVGLEVATSFAAPLARAGASWMPGRRPTGAAPAAAATAARDSAKVAARVSATPAATVAATTAVRVTTPTLEPTPDTDHPIPVPPGGLLLGLDPAGRPVILTLFRRRPLAATVVGGLHLAQVLTLRAAAVGARVIVETARPEDWDPVVLHGGLDSGCLAIHTVGRVAGNPGWAPPAPTAPLLVIRDCGARPPYASVPHGPWVAVVTLLPFLDPHAATHLGHADLLGFQRMPAEEAALAQRVLALADRDAATLTELPVDGVLWRAKDRKPRSCEITGTAWELRVLGPAHR